MTRAAPPLAAGAKRRSLAVRAAAPWRRLAPLAARAAALRGERGQATVELVALLPLLLAAALAGGAVLAAHAAGEQAGVAAEAGAIAIVQGGDALEAARRALPPGVRARATITVRGHRVTVRVRPDVPIAALARPLTGEATADAGPEGGRERRQHGRRGVEGDDRGAGRGAGGRTVTGALSRAARWEVAA